MSSKKDNIEEEMFKKMLKTANLNVKPSYTSTETCNILSISKIPKDYTKWGQTKTTD